jgi:hypothetical protein
VGTGLISWVPHFTTGIGWALRVGLYGLQQAQCHLDEKWVGIADFTIQIGSKKALMVLRVPVSALSQGKALTLKQVDVIGLSLGETCNGERVKTYLPSLFDLCGWPSHVVSDGGSDIKKGITDALLEAPNRASWMSDVTHFVANALKHYSAKWSLFQQFQTLCTRIRQRLQQTQFAFLLPPKARAKGRFLSVSRQAVGPPNPQLLGGDGTRALSASRCSGSGAARAQVVQAVSDDPRAPYDVLERGDANGENPRIECGVDSSVSGATR